MVALFSENPILSVGQNGYLTYSKVVALEESSTIEIHAFLMPFMTSATTASPNPSHTLPAINRPSPPEVDPAAHSVKRTKNHQFEVKNDQKYPKVKVVPLF